MTTYKKRFVESVLFNLTISLCCTFSQKYTRYENNPEYEIRVEPTLQFNVVEAQQSCMKEGGDLLEINNRSQLIFVNEQIGMSDYTSSK